MIEGERKLATIRRVSKIEPIFGADKIVCLHIDGWQLVSGINNFKEGDLCVYFEIDSFLPVRPEFEFLRDRCFKSTKNLGDGFRLKTIKLRGQVSQGLALPLSDFFQHSDKLGWYYEDPNEDSWIPVSVGEESDVTEFLKVQKYEKPEPTGQGSKFGPSHSRGFFPAFIPKTDQERAQNCLEKIKYWIYKEHVVEKVLWPDVDGFETMGNNFVAPDGSSYWFNTEEGQWYRNYYVDATPEVIAERQRFEATLKLDGSSMTVYYNDGQLGVCSRNLDLKRDPENLFWKVAVNSGVIQKLAHYGKNIAIQGELMGPGVQGNREKLEHNMFFVFDVYNIDEKRYLAPEERLTSETSDILDDIMFSDSFDHIVGHVPIMNYDFKIERDTTVQSLLDYVDTQRSLNIDIPEGVVFKNHSDPSKTFKIISNRFLLGEKD